MFAVSATTVGYAQLYVDMVSVLTPPVLRLGRVGNTSRWYRIISRKTGRAEKLPKKAK